MNKGKPAAGFVLFSIISTGVLAGVQDDELLKLLKTPVAEYKLDTKPYVIDPKIAHRQYEVTWRIPPYFKVSAEDYRNYRRPIKVEMIVEAGSGVIIQSKTLRSSGSAGADQRVHDALQNAVLQSLPMVEKTMRYTLVHEFNLNGPL